MMTQLTAIGIRTCKDCTPGRQQHLIILDVSMCVLTLRGCWVQAEQFSYCQPWMLAWGYRKQNLVAELVSYNADIMCLQVGTLSCKQRIPA